mmetsp:Transcript_39497/g.92417  ORF Transcript_39497/g.92417 Transcript_39497/m.92417 type:complete len:96 (+) Transcript_39497:332-619(+)
MFEPLATGQSSCYLIKADYFPAGVRMYKEMDEVSMSVYPIDANNCRVRAYSHTLLVTAHCDAGRNYANLESILKRLGLLRYRQTTLFGCPQRNIP